VLCGRSGHADVVDAHVALHASERGHDVVTSDPDDLHRIAPGLRLIVV
jgi:H2-forming N5,N10-methylenetetrahydromethanopterin dehydrogenase-like enzyme